MARYVREGDGTVPHGTRDARWTRQIDKEKHAHVLMEVNVLWLNTVDLLSEFTKAGG